MDPRLVLTSTQKQRRFRKREKRKAVDIIKLDFFLKKRDACPEFSNIDESEQLETQGGDILDISRIDELEPIHQHINDDLTIQYSETSRPDVSMLGIDTFWFKYILDYITEYIRLSNALKK